MKLTIEWKSGPETRLFLRKKREGSVQLPPPPPPPLGAAEDRRINVIV